ncbi:melanoregulin-like [Branchiostoma floridae]|uniref:Melanoregulin-like n=2 Tax=Branchiostoma floridae TaxID=7739 RepID=A0A9J7KG04_BRAFL|nr:melanoregulin-like [Branchiostoma floridae]
MAEAAPEGRRRRTRRHRVIGPDDAILEDGGLISMLTCCFRGEPSMLRDERLEEKQPLLTRDRGDSIHYYDQLPARRLKDDDLNIWHDPQDRTHMETDEDLELYNLIRRRDECPRGSDEWSHLNFDIHTVRTRRREIRDRWVKILEMLGFDDLQEIDNILTVTAVTKETISQGAKDLFNELSEESSIFGVSSTKPARYLYVLERLIHIDLAQTFVETAKQLYPSSLVVSCCHGRATPIPGKPVLMATTPGGHHVKVMRKVPGHPVRVQSSSPKVRQKDHNSLNTCTGDYVSIPTRKRSGSPQTSDYSSGEDNTP